MSPQTPAACESQDEAGTGGNNSDKVGQEQDAPGAAQKEQFDSEIRQQMNNLAPNESVIGDPIKDTEMNTKPLSTPYTKTITVL